MNSKKLKKTIYFTGDLYNVSDLDPAIYSATKKRDKFIEENFNFIAKIENEALHIIQSNNAQYINVAVQLNYYEI